MFAMKIKMKANCENSNDLTEIDSIYLTGLQKEGFYKKENIYDYLKDGGRDILVYIQPYPKLQPVLSRYGEKYVRSESDEFRTDNLLNLPRE